ncbi:uncharacterized protein si:dkey-1h6.8 [Xyrichtys novacula]|uniref:Uncharacterized protein si:dkey-1h6.8 n=1 Tax=Xyrichtys novacula TaxID=13765 RepID=A0AAV1GX63_XYRNO|nr:uncharacterized protein si:dkey-1h6.8 [Xyrichtys novacula]
MLPWKQGVEESAPSAQCVSALRETDQLDKLEGDPPLALCLNMESEDGDCVQQVEKITLRRKLTGPPRLLLPRRTRTRSSDQTKTRNNNKSSLKSPETDDISQDVLSAVDEENSRGADGDARNRKVRKRRWWRRFSPELICVRRWRTEDEDSLEKRKNSWCSPPEEVLQETSSTAPNDTNKEENSEEVSTGRNRFKVKTWSRIRGFLTQRRDSADRDEDGDELPVSFRKKLRDFLSRKSTWEDEEEMQRREDVQGAPAALTREETGGSLEKVRAEVSDEPQRTETQALEEEMEEVGKQTDNTHGEDFQEVPPPEGDQEEKIDPVPSCLLQPNGPSILIQLVPPDDPSLADEDEEVWEVSSSLENHSLLLLLLTSEPGEQQLIQTARSLVRAAMRAAVDQLIREQRGLGGELRETLAAQRVIQTLN